MELETRVYAMIFVAGVEGISREQLANILKVDLSQIDEALATIKLTLQSDPLAAIELVNYNHHVRFVTKPELMEDVIQFAQSPLNQKLTRAAIETLAIIAYKQPITRMGIDEIRGVSSSSLIQKLQLRDLVQEVGRLDSPGRPVLYGVTPYFMDYFGLGSLEDLPIIEPLSLNEEEMDSDLFSTKQWFVQLDDEEKEAE